MIKYEGIELKKALTTLFQKEKNPSREKTRFIIQMRKKGNNNYLENNRTITLSERARV